MAEILIIGFVFICAVVYLGRRFFKTTRGNGGCGCGCGGCGSEKCPTAEISSAPSPKAHPDGKSP